MQIVGDLIKKNSLGFIVLFGLLVRFAGVNHSLWGDEFFSLYWPQRGIGYMWGAGRPLEGNPPLFLSIFLYWTKLFGTTETAMRSLSIVFSVLAIPVVYLLGKKLIDLRVGLMAAFLFALNPSQIFFSQQARSYSLQTFLVAVCLLGIAYFVDNNPAGLNKRKYGIGIYCIAASLLAHVHYVAPLFIATCGTAVFFALCFKEMPRAQKINQIKLWCVANAAVALVSASEIPYILNHSSYPGLFMLQLSHFEIPGILFKMIAGTTIRFVEYPLLLLVLASGCLLYRKPPLNDAPTVLVILIIPLAYVALLLAINEFHTVFADRVLFFLTIPACLLIANFVYTLPSATERRVLFLSVLVSYIPGQPLLKAPHISFRESFAQLAVKAAPDDMIVFGPHDPIGALDYYQPHLFHTNGVWRWTADNAWPRMVEDTLWEDLFSPRQIDTKALTDDIARGKTVWLIMSNDDELYHNQLLKRVDRLPDTIIGPKDPRDSDLRIYGWRASAPAPAPVGN